MWETAPGSPGGRHETVTLQAETKTPRRRTLSASFVRVSTPLVELPVVRRQRLKNEGKARARALERLDPVKHEHYLVSERARKQDAALRLARGEKGVQRAKRARTDDTNISHAEMPSPAWKQHARERVAAELQAGQQRKDDRVARTQEARVQRDAVTGSRRCGSCATCVELVMFGGTLEVKSGRPCVTVLQRGPCETREARPAGSTGPLPREPTPETRAYYIDALEYASNRAESERESDLVGAIVWSRSGL